MSTLSDPGPGRKTPCPHRNGGSASDARADRGRSGCILPSGKGPRARARGPPRPRRGRPRDARESPEHRRPRTGDRGRRRTGRPARSPPPRRSPRQLQRPPPVGPTAVTQRSPCQATSGIDPTASQGCDLAREICFPLRTPTAWRLSPACGSVGAVGPAGRGTPIAAPAREPPAACVANGRRPAGRRRRRRVCAAAAGCTRRLRPPSCRAPRWWACPRLPLLSFRPAGRRRTTTPAPGAR